MKQEAPAPFHYERIENFSTKQPNLTKYSESNFFSTSDIFD